jgi:DNA polymerase
MHLPLLTKQAKSCTLCDIGKRSNRRIIFRGSNPCQVLFVGKSADDTDKVLGEPFVGPAGKLLDAIIEEALPGVSCGFTNSIYCVPTDSITRRLRTPKDGEIKNCSTHLITLASTLNPIAVVAVGNSGDKAIKKVKQITIIQITIHTLNLKSNFICFSFDFYLRELSY